MKVSTENDNNFGYEKITIFVDNIPLSYKENVAFIKINHGQTFNKPSLYK
jgi:hypothetical protein